MSCNVGIKLQKKETINLKVQPYSSLKINIGNNSGGTSNYNFLTNKPQINGVSLIGNKLSSDIHVQDEMNEITPQDIDKIIYGG